MITALVMCFSIDCCCWQIDKAEFHQRLLKAAATAPALLEKIQLAAAESAAAAKAAEEAVGHAVPTAPVVAAEDELIAESVDELQQLERKVAETFSAVFAANTTQAAAAGDANSAGHCRTERAHSGEQRAQENIAALREEEASAAVMAAEEAAARRRAAEEAAVKAEQDAPNQATHTRAEQHHQNATLPPKFNGKEEECCSACNVM